MDKRYLAIGVLAGAIALLLLFGSSQRADADTYKTKYSATLSCNGPDGQYDPPHNTDNSCVASAPYYANAVGLTADIISHFEIPYETPQPRYSTYQYLATFGTPAGFEYEPDKEIPDGAAVGKVVLAETLALFGGACTTTLVAPIPMYDCSTDIWDTITWDAASKGENLLEGPKGDLPAGCRHYPAHLTDVIGAVESPQAGEFGPTSVAVGFPRARYFGATVVTDGSSPTQLELVTFSPHQLTREVSLPANGFIDDLGYVTYVVLDNPLASPPAGDALDEICAPLAYTTTLWGKTAGQGGLTQQIGPLPSNPPPTLAGSFWTVADDICYDGVDNDHDNTTDEMCGIERLKNPALATSGLWGTGSHLVGAYSESYRDADGDGIPNNQDECPFDPDLASDSDNDFINDACEPVGDTDHDGDQDNDGYRNQQDNCPLVANPGQADADKDNIGDLCDTRGNGPSTPDGAYLNDQPVGSVCIGAADTDKDGAVNDGCPTEGSHAPKYSEGGAWCGALGIGNSIDEDNDGAVDDGCGSIPVFGAVSEAANHCNDTVNDDPGDDAVVNDGCPTVANVAETVAAGQCSNTTDDETDGDGWCDATEDKIGSGGERLSKSNDVNSTPEWEALDYSLVAAEPTPGAAPHTCGNWDYYDTNSLEPNHHGAGSVVDDDGDGFANGNDPNCPNGDKLLGSDNDVDGVPNATDNCINVWNPTQLDTDGGCTTAIPETAGQCGDACDTDDDNDNILDTVEWAQGSDAKNVCDPINFDTKPSGKISAADIVAFMLPLRLPNRPCNPPVNYNVCR